MVGSKFRRGRKRIIRSSTTPWLTWGTSPLLAHTRRKCYRARRFTAYPYWMGHVGSTLIECCALRAQ